MAKPLTSLRARVTANITMALLSPLIFLGILEGASYLLAGSLPTRSNPLITRAQPLWTTIREYDHLLFWRMKPNTTRGKLTTNSLGLRYAELPPEKGEEFWALSLGESSTLASNLPSDQTYTALVEEQIGSIGTRRLRMINAGVAGYTLLQGFVYLKYHGLHLEPDAVLLYFGHNDFLPVAYLGRRDMSARQDFGALDDWSLFEKRRRPISRIHAWIFDRSNLLRYLESILRPPASGTGAAPRTLRQPRVPRERRWELLQRISELCRERGIQLTIIVPWYKLDERHIPLLRRFTQRHGVPVVDLPSKLHSLEPGGEYFVDDVHPNAEGHRVIAAEIAKVVEPLWLRSAGHF